MSNNFRKEEDLLSNSNKGMLKGISRVTSPHSSYHNGFEFDKNSNFDERYGRYSGG